MNWWQINLYTFLQLQIHQYTWFEWQFWQQHLLPAIIQVGTQLGTVAMQQVASIGMFIDAKEQLETQRDLQELHALAHKNYHPSQGMCEFGTRIKSLASAERKGEMNSLIMSERSTDRLLGNKDTGSSGGPADDVTVRLSQFTTKFCDSHDHNQGLVFMCSTIEASTIPTQEQKERFNKDIDFGRLIMDPWTIDFDLTDDEDTGDADLDPSNTDEEVLAMASNLYGFNTFPRPSAKELARKPGHHVTDIQSAYIDMRSVAAKTKVAENSFLALLALKGKGEYEAGYNNEDDIDENSNFVGNFLVELGIPEEHVFEYYGENPSYYAQMEILTKKAYQSQLFYTNLYDKPANVKRKSVAMQAIGLIQKFDLLKSYLRTEASLSILLELNVEELQREVEDNIKAFNERIGN